MNNNQNWNYSSATANNQPNNQTLEQPNPQANNQTPQQPSALMQIVGAVLPSLIEHFTGQKMTAGGNGETQLVLTQLLGIQQQMVSNLQALNQRLVQLENNASQQLTNLTQQVQSIKSIRLSQEKKQIDFNLQQADEPNKY